MPTTLSRRTSIGSGWSVLRNRKPSILDYYRYLFSQQAILREFCLPIFRLNRLSCMSVRGRT